MSATPTTRHGPRAELVLLIGALSAFAPLSIDMYLPGLPAIADGPGRVTRPRSSSRSRPASLGLALGQLIAGPLSDTFGRRRPLLVGPRAVQRRVAAVRRRAVGLGPRRRCGCSRAWAARRASSSRARWCATTTQGSAAARFFALTMLVNGLAPILAPDHRRPAAAHHHVAGRVRGARRPSARSCSWSPRFRLRGVAAAGATPERTPGRRRRTAIGACSSTAAS